MPSPSALVVLSSGIGNVVRWSSAVRMLHQSGYAVDVFLDSPDYAEVTTLLLGAPEIRTVYGTVPPHEYDVAWVPQFYKTPSQQINGGRITRMPTELWREVGDPGAMLWHAAKLGWSKPIPRPFVRKSERRFNLPSGTVAIHPGCKAGWPWKRYPHFAGVAAWFEHVVIVGTDEDRIAGEWPRHVVDYTGQLSLLDTAALLSQCAAVICNDSGLSHVAAALNAPTFPIYGATKPQREMMPLPNVHPLENKTECRIGCNLGGRCLRTAEPSQCIARLRPDTVADVVRRALPVLV